MYISTILAALVLTLTVITIGLANSVYSATTNDTDDINKPLYRQIQELRINPHFAPDESSMFDAYQLHCIPGEDQECPEGFGSNEDATCFVSKKNGCPDGYHGEDDDETGQCYPDTKPCWPGMIRYPSDRAAPAVEACGDTEDVCKKYNMSLPESCIVDGRSIIDFPTADCLIYPDHDNCAFVEGYGCPVPDFTMMTSANFTVPRCVPIDDEEVLEEE